MWKYNNTDELLHYGVLGMKWGVRRSEKQLARARKKAEAKQVHEDYAKAHSKKSVKSMSNQELRDVNNRLQMEKQYKSLNKKANKGKKAVDTFVGTAGTITAAVGAYKVYKKTAEYVVDKAGDYVVKSIKF